MRQLIITALFIATLSGQTLPVVVADLPYAVLPFPVRIENSGIYAVASFRVEGNTISLLSSDRGELYDVVNQHELIRRSGAAGKYEESVESFRPFRRPLTDNRDGSYSDGGGIVWNIRVNGRNDLHVTSSALNHDIHLVYPSDLAYAELIGIDADGNIFLLVERYRSEIPLRVQREILVLNRSGEQRSVLEIPDIKYLATDKDFRIDGDGNLYHMMSTEKGIRIFRWSSLAAFHLSPLTYPDGYSYSLHYNEIVPAEEAPGDPVPEYPVAAASRTQALRIGESYAVNQYSCSSANLAPVNVTGPDGDIVRTPPWLVGGTNARIPYKWGGFSTLVQFADGLKAGKYAGDINTTGVSSYAVGVDCSGFVSRCWQMTYHSSTSMMPSITTQYASWDSLKPGDAIHKVGHVRLFIERSANGGFRVVESAGRNWDVSYWTFAPSDLQGVYTPRFYNGMETNSSFQRPVLTSVVTMPENEAMLSWTCDTSGIVGYRVYKSVDGMQWTLYKNETIIGKNNSVRLPVTAAAEFYRLSSVKNDAARTESDWSNAVGASKTRGPFHFLIVDGFERLTASWESVSHTFSSRYGVALQKAGATFSSMKNSAALADTSVVFGYDGIIWFAGDEGTVNETFSSQEQSVLRTFLQRGKALLVSGSEIGYDLSQNGSSSDKEFYATYLKSAYRADNAGSAVVKASAGFYTGNPFRIGQLYVEDSPDEIDTLNGSTIAVRYDNNKVAGVQYSGHFGGSALFGKLIYLSFALETAGNDTAMNTVIKQALDFFAQTPLSATGLERLVPQGLRLENNYPNPFNPSTRIQFHTAGAGHVSLKVFDMLGREAATLVDGWKDAGTYSAQFKGAANASGVYFARLQCGDIVRMIKMHLLK